MNPFVIQDRLAAGQGMDSVDVIHEERSSDDIARLEQIRSVLDRLPSNDAEIVQLYFFERFTQARIAVIYGVSQPTVCYRLQRAVARLKFLVNTPPPQDFEDDLAQKGYSELDRRILELFEASASQSAVGRRIGKNQSFVRRRLLRLIDRMCLDPELLQVAQFFRQLFAHSHLLRAA